MSRDINDSEIRVNIRTGPEETKTERVNTHRYVGNDFMGYVPLEFIYTSSIFGDVPYNFLLLFCIIVTRTADRFYNNFIILIVM